MLFLDQKGFFNKTITEIPENLYLDFKTHDIMFIKNDVINFASVVDIDPHKIMDLDDCCTIELLNKSQVDFDFRSLGGRKLNKKKVKHNLERKYKVKVKDSELIIFPLWECTIKNKKDGKTTNMIYLLKNLKKKLPYYMIPKKIILSGLKIGNNTGQNFQVLRVVFQKILLPI